MSKFFIVFAVIFLVAATAPAQEKNVRMTLDELVSFLPEPDGSVVVDLTRFRGGEKIINPSSVVVGDGVSLSITSKRELFFLVFCLDWATGDVTIASVEKAPLKKLLLPGKGKAFRISPTLGAQTVVAIGIAEPFLPEVTREFKQMSQTDAARLLKSLKGGCALDGEGNIIATTAFNTVVVMPEQKK